jgi:hypothetical protein
MSAIKLTANQYVLLAALKRGAGLPQPELLGVNPEIIPVFPSQRGWLAAATALYLELWPGGSNPEWGPQKAIRPVLRKLWVTQAQRGRALVPALTELGLEVLRDADPRSIRPKSVVDVLAEIREQRVSAAKARLFANSTRPTTDES